MQTEFEKEATFEYAVASQRVKQNSLRVEGSHIQTSLVVLMNICENIVTVSWRR